MREKKEFQAYESRALKKVPGTTDLRPLCMSCTPMMTLNRAHQEAKWETQMRVLPSHKKCYKCCSFIYSSDVPLTSPLACEILTKNIY